MGVWSMEGDSASLLQFARGPYMTGESTTCAMSTPVDPPNEERPAKGPPPSSEPRVLSKDALEFRAFPSELEVQIWDYHADPVHLSLEELQHLGLSTTGDRAGLAASQVAPWRRALREGRERDTLAPRLCEDTWARALHLGGVALLPVADGVDVYIVSYHTTPVRLGAEHLQRLGLRYPPP
jgi:hypothetical protein